MDSRICLWLADQLRKDRLPQPPKEVHGSVLHDAGQKLLRFAAKFHSVKPLSGGEETEMHEVSLGLVRELKGAPLAVVLLLVSPEPVSRRWLERASGYSEKPVEQACQYLHGRGVAVYRASCCRMAGDFKLWGAEMFRIEHVTPEYARARLQEYEAQSLKGPRRSGMYISTLEKDEPLRLAPNGHSRKCNCPGCEVNKF